MLLLESQGWSSRKGLEEEWGDIWPLLVQIWPLSQACLSLLCTRFSFKCRCLDHKDPWDWVTWGFLSFSGMISRLPCRMMLGNSCLSLATVSHHHKRLPSLPMNTLQQHPRKGRSSISIYYHMGINPTTQLRWADIALRDLILGTESWCGVKKQTGTDWRLVPWVVWLQHLPNRKGLLQGPANRNDHNHTSE